MTEESYIKRMVEHMNEMHSEMVDIRRSISDDNKMTAMYLLRKSREALNSMAKETSERLKTIQENVPS